MKLSADNPLKYLSVKWPLWDTFIFGLLPAVLQQGMDTQVIPAEYHAVLLSVVLPILGYIGKKKYQPEPALLGFASIPADSISFEEAFRRLIGHEGGYSKDKRDPGNWTGGKVGGVGILKGTKFGLAANTYNLDIKNITLAQAKEIYQRDW